MPLPQREIEDIHDPRIPNKTRLSPMGELDIMDAMVERHGEDMRRACCAPDPGTHPREEPQSTPKGMPGIDPIDADLEEADFGRGFLKRIEPVMPR